jgi:hypothetical protein
MRQARLIKKAEQMAQREPSAESSKASAQKLMRTTVETAQAWIKERLVSEPRSPREQFAALFS